MKQLIACCGIDCGNCDARIATIADDDKLREETAQKWSEMFEANIAAESVNCTGCRTEGVKFSQCDVCEIRKCAIEKGFGTCGECEELDTCQIVGFVLQNVPGAKENLCS
jgi:hypothetical protein